MLPFHLNVVGFFLASYSSFLITPVDPHPRPGPRPWEAYSDREPGLSLQEFRGYHDTFYTGMDVIVPMIGKMAKEKYEEYLERYHGKEVKAGKAGRDHTSEEMSKSREREEFYKSRKKSTSSPKPDTKTKKKKKKRKKNKSGNGESEKSPEDEVKNVKGVEGVDSVVDPKEPEAEEGSDF